MDLSNFQKVAKANSANFPKRQDFDIIYHEKTSRFKISEDTFKALSLDDNSLIQYNKTISPGEGVYLHVVPGNTGVFMKKFANRSKGRAFKNSELVTSLNDFGINVIVVKYLKLEEIGLVDEYPMYKVTIDAERYDRLVLNASTKKSISITDTDTDVESEVEAAIEESVGDDEENVEDVFN